MALATRRLSGCCERSLPTPMSRHERWAILTSIRSDHAFDYQSLADILLEVVAAVARRSPANAERDVRLGADSAGLAASGIGVRTAR